MTKCRVVLGGVLALLVAAVVPAGAQDWAFTVPADAGSRSPFARVFVPNADGAAAQGENGTPAAIDGILSLVPSTDPGEWLDQQPTAPHPAPRHTGFKALVFETGSDFNAFPRRQSTWVILGIGAAAAAIAHPLDDNTNARLKGKGIGRVFAPGKYIGSVPVQAGVATGLYVIGRYILPPAEGQTRTNKMSHLGFDLMRALIVSQALTQAVKITVRRDRPTGECCAFPSGHASATFATASVLERHLGYRAAWPTLLVAAYVSASRLHDNKHFLSDVLFGSALGMASGWTVVGRHGRSQYALVPAATRGGIQVALVRTRTMSAGH